jgi:hypothetical protein
MLFKLYSIVSTRARTPPASAPEEQEPGARAEAEGGEEHGPTATDQPY